MQLIQVEVIGLKPLERTVQSESQVPRIEVHSDAAMVEVASHLRGEEHVFAAALQSLAENFLAVPPAVDVGGIEEVHPEFDRSSHGLDRSRIRRRAIRIPVGVPPNGPCAKPDLGHRETGSAQGLASHRPPNEAISKNLWHASPTAIVVGRRTPSVRAGRTKSGMNFAAKGSRGLCAERVSAGASAMHTKAILLALCLLATGFAAMFGIPVVHGATLANDKLVEETGPTTALGGGDHVFVRFGNDAAFGVVYGTTANPNNIYIVAIKARYLGVAQVKDAQGRSYAENRPIKIYTLYAVKLDSLVEFKDSNGNGIANYARVYNSTTDRFSDYINRAATLYKKADLNTSWTAGSIVQSNGTAYRSWTFNLSAQNLPYAAVANYTGNVTGNLPLARFTFQLNAS